MKSQLSSASWPSLLLPLLLVACGDGADGFRPVTGTGSAGGNPLTVSFRHDPASNRGDLEWRTPSMAINQMQVALPDARGGCSLEGAEIRNVERTFAFDELSQLLFHPPFPCGIVLLPPPERPLLSSEAQVDDGKLARVEIWAQRGMHIRINAPDRLFASQDVFFLIRVDRLLDQLDFTEILSRDDLVVYSDRAGDGAAQADRVRANFVTAARIYLDPTPGDGRLAPNERVSDNVIGSAGLLVP